jgi:3-oxoacyl-[acyl-carrier-protein] synthase-3
MGEGAGRGPAAVVCGAGSWLPPRRVDNHELSLRLDTSDEWIRSRTGIGARHVVDGDCSTGDLAVEAARLALKSADTTDVDAVVLATVTPDRRCPATAPEVAARLGLTGVAAYDVAAVCTGFLYGLATATGLIAAGVAGRVLLLGAETFTTILDPADRTTVPIFGDGAGGLVLRAGEHDEPGAVGPIDLGSDGGLADHIWIPAGGSRQPRVGLVPGDGYFTMQGRKVYRHAVERMTGSVLTVLERAGWDVADVDRFVPHQANARITGAVAERLGIGPDRCLSNVERVGNTSAASIPILLDESTRSGALRAGDRTLLTAFGGGLTWGSATLVWPELSTAPALPAAPVPA